MRTFAKALMFGSALTVVGVMGSPASATAVELFSASIDQVVRGSEGDVIEVASIPVPEEFVGSSCSVVGETENQESVHIGNDLLIVGSVKTLTISDFEDEGFARHQAGDLDALPDVIRVFVRLGADGISSGGFRVSIECPASPGDVRGESSTTIAGDDTTTSTAPVTTEETSETTTAASETTPTTGSTPSATTEPADDADTTAPTTAATTTPTTTTPTTTTTTTTAATGAQGDVDDDEPEGSLAATGFTAGLLVATGSLLVASGVGLTRVARRRADQPAAST